MAGEKTLREKAGPTLRDRARFGSSEEKAEAVGELRRRLGNLRGAVVPAWELALRGPRPEDWDVER